jgi:hypothetical protein
MFLLVLLISSGFLGHDRLETFGDGQMFVVRALEGRPLGTSS